MHRPPKVMERLVARWQVPFAPRPYAVARYGGWGVPVVLFPTGGSDYLDNERFQLVDALAPLVDAGRVKVYSVDAPNRDVWTNPDASPAHRSWAQARYDEWLVAELFPFIREDCRGGAPGIVVAGASLGAYQALNAFARHPDDVAAGVGLSGTYVLDRRMAGHVDDAYSFNQPARFLPNLGPSPQLDALRRGFFQFGLGSGPHENPAPTWQLADILGACGIPNHVDVWGAGTDHDWPTWRAMLPVFLDRLLPRVLARAA